MVAKGRQQKAKPGSVKGLKLTSAQRAALCKFENMSEEQKLHKLQEVAVALQNGKEVDAEECFLPLLLLFGLWGGSRALRGRSGFGGGFGGYPGGYGAYGGMPGWGAGFGGPGSMGSGAMGPGGMGSGMRGFGRWPMMF